MMRITLKGVPPSLNRFAGRQNSWEYRDAKSYWTQLVWAASRASKDRPAKPMEKADVEILYYFPTRSRHDADNYSGKFILDGLVKAGILQDDSFAVIDLVLKADIDPGKKGYTIIEVEI